MTASMITVFEILAALAFGFFIGRIWQIRRDELEQRVGYPIPSIARIPQPADAEFGQSR
jgi:hypothetical protein